MADQIEMPNDLDPVATFATVIGLDLNWITISLPHTPSSTYRLQLHAGFTLSDVCDLVPYLDSLGIDDVYLSPLLASRTGSMHGYDIVTHNALNPELGTQDQFQTLADCLQSRSMGILLDIVPNHMCVNRDNAWWKDVLENGPASTFASHFDIAFYDQPRPQLQGKVLLPILGDTYGQTLEAGQLQLHFTAGAFQIRYYDTILPIDPRTYDFILTPVADALRSSPCADEAISHELQSILLSIKHLPPRNETDEAKQHEAQAEATVIKRRLATLETSNRSIAALLADRLNQINGTPENPTSFEHLDFLLEQQAYRLSFWRVASDEINYRRFFDVNDLAALSTERLDVFQAIHQKIFEWIGNNLVRGLRIDHPDGLFNPSEYFHRIQLYTRLARAKQSFHQHHEEFPELNWEQLEPHLLSQLEQNQGRSIYVVAEKILATQEQLRHNWNCDGTTGYECLNAINNLYVSSANEQVLSHIYHEFTDTSARYDDIVYQNKFLMLQTTLASELHMLAHQLDRLAQHHRWSRDFTLNGLRHAIREVIACFPVYRSYISDMADSFDRSDVTRAIAAARRRNPVLGRYIFDFIRNTLLLMDPPQGTGTATYRAEQQRFAGKFQQVTAPVMAKGLEDTTFYIYNRFVSLNEVGGEPNRFGWQADALHRFFQARSTDFSGGLSPLTTHDTKRSEDVRARLNVLSELPEQWASRVHHWATLNRRHKIEVDGILIPDRNEEYFLYQTLLGSWPIPESQDDDPKSYTARIQDYMNKAIHEAKVHTSWINSNADHDAAIQQFVSRILDPDLSAEFIADFMAFTWGIIPLGLYNSLSQTLLRCTVPGVPDTYQGTEIWYFSLVDPDNRRPVDFRLRQRMLEQIDDQERNNRELLLRSLMDMHDGRIKLFLISRILRYRRQYPDLFRHGDYLEVKVDGARAEHVFAFTRTLREHTILVLAPRLIAGLFNNASGSRTGGEVWGDTFLQLPASFSEFEWTNLFTRQTYRFGGNTANLAEVLDTFPLAVLVNQSIT